MELKLAHLLLTTSLMTLIWLIQILHYPTFHHIERMKFSRFAGFHSSRISFIVMPLMLAELVLCLLTWDYISLFLVALIWISTFTLQVPCHHSFATGYSEVTVKRLISTNWIRTLLWTVKFIYLLWKF